MLKLWAQSRSAAARSHRVHISGASRAGRRLCTTTDDTPKDVKEKDPAVRRPKLWQLDGSFQGDLSAFHDAVVSHTSAHSTQDQGKRGKKAQRFMRITPVKGAEDDYLYRIGVTRGLGDVSDGQTHITELRSVEAYKMYGDMDRIKRTDFFQMSHIQVKLHVQWLADTGRVLPWKVPEEGRVLRYSWKNYLQPQSQAHDGARKVKMEVHVGDLGLDEVGQATLSLLAGPRYNAHSRVLKLTSDSLPLREQNKSYIQDLLVALVMEAQNPETQLLALEAKQELGAAAL